MSASQRVAAVLLRVNGRPLLSTNVPRAGSNIAKRRGYGRGLDRIRKSPTVKDTKLESRYQSIGISKEFLNEHKKRDERWNKALENFEKHKYDLWYHQVRNRLKPDLPYEEFARVGARLINRVYEITPTASAARGISPEIGITLVYEVGRVLFAIDPVISAWTTEATAQAGALHANLRLAAKQVNAAVGSPPVTTLLRGVQTLAEVYGHPCAMALHAKVLLKRKEYDKALQLLDQLMARLYPTMIPPASQEDITISGLLEPPWELYALIIEERGQHENTNMILKTAALTFEDPESLLTYAHIVRVQGDMDMYERCMVKAAASGHREACRKLANFYLLVSLGRQTAYEQKRTGSALLRLMGGGRSLQSYRKTAIDWYEVAYARECGKSTLILAALLREDGDLERAELCLASAEEDGRFPKLIQKMRRSWKDENFKFPFPDRWMDID